MNLYEIDKAYVEALENAMNSETGEVDEYLLESLQCEYQQKIDNTVCYIKNVEALNEAIDKEIKRLESVLIGANDKVQTLLAKYESTPLKTGTTLAELIRRPELSYETVAELDPDRPVLDEDVIEQININIKYDGYIKRQLKQVEHFKKLESKKLDPNFDYNTIEGLRKEAKQKLNAYKPMSVGQASRISGVSPADITVLLIHLNINWFNGGKTYGT